jgi:hypothetical protein
MHERRHSGYPPEARFTRVFQPDTLDLTDLAEAVRLLLGEGSEAHHSAPSDLPSAPARVSHVVEAISQ